MPRLLQVRTGHARSLHGHVTAYAKEERHGPVAVHQLGLQGDEVGNPRVHGGAEKAVYAYSAQAYPLWRQGHARHAERLVPGAFGENLLIDGLTEATTHIGDCWRIGTALLQVCQPRQPCVTLARWFDDPAMVKAMVRNGLSGWYLRVLEPGEISAGDELHLEGRPPHGFTIARVLEASYRSPPNRDELQALSQAQGLAPAWATWAARTAQAEQPGPKPL